MGGREENKEEEVVKEVVMRVQDKSVSQGDFNDPEYCMRYFHCDRDLRVSRCFCSLTWLQPTSQASLQYCATGTFFAPLDDEVKTLFINLYFMVIKNFEISFIIPIRRLSQASPQRTGDKFPFSPCHHARAREAVSGPPLSTARTGVKCPLG